MEVSYHNLSDALARLWNTFIRVGCPVYVTEDDGSVTETKTRSTAWVSHSGDAVIMVEDRAGSYLLSRVRVNPNIVKIFANTNPKEFAVASNEGSKYDPKDDPDCPPCDCGYEVIDCFPYCSRVKHIRKMLGLPSKT